MDLLAVIGKAKNRIDQEALYMFIWTRADKVQHLGEPSIADLVSGDTPFGLATNFAGYKDTPFRGSVALYLTDRGQRSALPAPPDQMHILSDAGSSSVDDHTHADVFGRGAARE